MSHDRISSKDEFWGPAEEAKPGFNVVVVYDCRRAGIRAMNVFRSLVRQFQHEYDFRCNLWRFDVLELPEAQAEAVRAGEAADVVVVSARGGSELPEAAKHWLDRCVAKRNSGWAALIGLFESRPQPGEGPCRTREFLQNAADRSLTNFLLLELDSLQTSSELAPDATRARAGRRFRPHPAGSRLGHP